MAFEEKQRGEKEKAESEIQFYAANRKLQFYASVGVGFGGSHGSQGGVGFYGGNRRQVCVTPRWFHWWC